MLAIAVHDDQRIVVILEAIVKNRVEGLSLTAINGRAKHDSAGGTGNCLGIITRSVINDSISGQYVRISRISPPIVLPHYRRGFNAKLHPAPPSTHRLTDPNTKERVFICAYTRETAFLGVIYNRRGWVHSCQNLRKQYHWVGYFRIYPSRTRAYACVTATTSSSKLPDERCSIGLSNMNSNHHPVCAPQPRYKRRPCLQMKNSRPFGK